MDLYKLQKKVLDDGARENGHANWESMKFCISESMANFIEKIVNKSVKDVWEVKIGQQTLS